jgi:hypothetical protein
MRGAIPPLLKYVFMAWCLVKHRDNFTFFTLYYTVWRLTTGWTTGCHFPTWAENFLFATESKPVLETTQPPIVRVPRVFPPGIKEPGREADNLAPSISEVKNMWSYTSTPQNVFVGWCLVKHRDNFTLPYLAIILDAM